MQYNTISLCPKCYMEVPAKIYREEHGVWMLKKCPVHGEFSGLVERDPFWFDFCKKVNAQNIYNGLMIDVTSRCNLKCQYCLPAGTKITTPDFKDTNIEDIKIGDYLLGFDEYSPRGIGKHRTVFPTKVLAIMKRESETIIITLENGYRLEVTPEHPLLNTRGISRFAWKQAGKYKIGEKVMVLPITLPTYINYNSIDYKTGYLISAFMGDGSYKHYIRKDGYDTYKIRIAVMDDEIIDYISEISQECGIVLYKKPFVMNSKTKEKKDALFANRKEVYNKLLDLIKLNLNRNNTSDYLAGFLSGIFDTEGTINGCVRMFNSNLNIINEIERSLTYFNFKYTFDKDVKWKNLTVKTVRILNHKSFSPEVLRFISLINPKIKRKGLTNFHHKSILTNQKIVNIENGHTQTVYNVATESHTYIANNFAVHNCYHSKGEDRYLPEIIYEVVNNKDAVPFILTGGEPTVHHKLAEIISEVSKHGETWVLTNGIKLNDEAYFDEITPKLIHDGIVNIGLSFHKESMGKDLMLLDLLRKKNLKLGTSFYVIDDLKQIDSALSIYRDNQDVMSEIRIKAASNLGSENHAINKIYTSDMLKYLSSIGKTEIDKRYNNKVSYANVIHAGLNIKLISWYDKDNIDLLDINCPPFYKSSDGKYYNMVTACLKNRASELKIISPSEESPMYQTVTDDFIEYSKETDVIRRAGKNDVIEVSYLWEAFIKESMPDSLPNRELWIKQTTAMMNNPDYYLYIAKDKGKIVGFQAGSLWQDASVDKLCVMGNSFYVKPEYRNTLIAPKLHRNGIKDAKKHHAQLFRREVDAEFLPFWEKKGYKKIRTVVESELRS